MAPMMGWTMSPVTGPARYNRGKLASSAPRYRYIGLMLLCWSPKLYWIPKKPTFMFTIDMNDRCGLLGAAEADADVGAAVIELAIGSP
ncbi:hypothetical protein MASR1M101_18060 [Gemmatimonas sp.]